MLSNKLFHLILSNYNKLNYSKLKHVQTNMCRCLSSPSSSPSIPYPGKSKEKNVMLGKEHVNIGTIGHVDHGKTTLTSAMTKISAERGFGKYVSFDEIDKAPEEQLRGVTINASHIEYFTAKRHYAHTDCPGHRDYVKNMICGTSQMDGAIVVVAGSEGQMPQTREHLILSRQIGVHKVVVYVNKCDLIDDEVKELVEIEMREMLCNFGYDGNETPFVFGSALMALNGDKSPLGEESVIKLLDTLDSYITPPERDLKSPFMLPIESCVSITGRGTVSIGTVERGVIEKGEQIELVGMGNRIKSAAIDIQMFKRSVGKCMAGDHVGILCRGVKSNLIERGMIISKPDSLSMTNRFEANLYMVSKGEGGRKSPITVRFIQQIFSKTWSGGVRIDVPDEEGGILMPGDHGKVHLTLLKGMHFRIGQSFTIRENHKTIASGIITKELPSVEIKQTLGHISFGYEKEAREKAPDH